MTVSGEDPPPVAHTATRRWIIMWLHSGTTMKQIFGFLHTKSSEQNYWLHIRK